jgi:hypothetical protein
VRDGEDCKPVKMRVGIIRLAIAVVAALSLATAGCSRGDDKKDDKATTTTVAGPKTDANEDGADEDTVLKQLPQMAGATAVGAGGTRGDVALQTYSAINQTPEQVLEYYARALPGWEPVGPVEHPNPSTIERRFKRGATELVVSAATGPPVNIDGTDQPQAVYTLTIRTPKDEKN